MTIVEEILQLKKERNALILAHYYQNAEVQEIADYVGDSYYLSKIAMDSPEQIIVFCGVKFMAESAKILSPHKQILLPALDAGCPMAEMANAESLIAMKKEHPNALVVCYINSTAEVKAECDISVTSSNAVRILSKMPQKEIIFLPDKNLGSYLAEKMPEKKFILWDGFCITHRKVNPNHILDIKALKPEALVLSHPECEKEVRDLSDFIGSTSEIIDYASTSTKEHFIIVTEQGVLHELKMKNPNKHFYIPGKTMTCVNMKKTGLEEVLRCLKNLSNAIEIEESMRLRALKCLENMHTYAR